MTFTESYNRAQAVAYSTGAGAAATPASGVGATTIYEQKMIMLRTLQDALADAQRTGDTRALKIYQEQMDAYTSSETSRIRIVNTLAANQGRLDVTAMQAVQRDIANIRDNQTRLLAADAQRGRSLMQDLVYKAAGADPRLAQAGGTPFRDYVLSVASASLNPNEPATWFAIQALKETYGEGSVNDKLGNVVARANAAHAQREGQVRALENVAIPPTATGANVETLLGAAGLTAIERPTFESARTEAGGATGEGALQADIAKLQQDLNLTGDAAEKPSRLGGLTEAQAQGILADPRFRSYAEDRGIQLSNARADGSYIITPQDLAAMRMAAKEKATGRSPAFSGANQPREQRDIQAVRPGTPLTTPGGRVGAPTEVPLVTLAEMSEDGDYIKKVYLTYADGRVEMRNLVTRDVEPLMEASGRALGSPAEVAAYRKAKTENGTSVFKNTQTGLPLTAAGIDELRGNTGLSLDYVDTESRDTAPTRPETFEDVRGLRMPTRLGEDPERVLRMLGQDGTTVTTYQKGPDDQWRETGTEANAYRGILRRPEDAMMANVQDRKLRQPSLDRYETPPRPLVDEVFGAQVTGEGIGAAARKLYTDGPPASDAPPEAFQAGEAVGPGLEDKILAQRVALERMRRARAGSVGYRIGGAREQLERSREATPGEVAKASAEAGAGRILPAVERAEESRAKVEARRQEMQERLAAARALKNPPPVPTADAASADASSIDATAEFAREMEGMNQLQPSAGALSYPKSGESLPFAQPVTAENMATRAALRKLRAAMVK